MKTLIYKLFSLAFICAVIAVISVARADTCPTGQFTYGAEVTDVYDGDTITANIDLGFHTWIHGEKLRLFGIDAPEMRGDEKPEGTKSRDWLRSVILDKAILIETVKDKKGKYGRYLATLYIQTTSGQCLNLNTELVRLKLAEYKDY